MEIRVEATSAARAAYNLGQTAIALARYGDPVTGRVLVGREWIPACNFKTSDIRRLPLIKRADLCRMRDNADPRFNEVSSWCGLAEHDRGALFVRKGVIR